MTQQTIGPQEVQKKYRGPVSHPEFRPGGTEPSRGAKKVAGVWAQCDPGT